MYYKINCLMNMCELIHKILVRIQCGEIQLSKIENFVLRAVMKHGNVYDLYSYLFKLELKYTDKNLILLDDIPF